MSAPKRWIFRIAYRIVEITAPAGYLLDSTPMEVSFTYEGQQIAWQVVDATNTNLRTSVDISKQDITNGKELPGAKLEIRDTDGNLVEGWTSTKTPHTVRGLELKNAPRMVTPKPKASCSSWCRKVQSRSMRCM